MINVSIGEQKFSDTDALCLGSGVQTWSRMVRSCVMGFWSNIKRPPNTKEDIVYYRPY